MTVAVPIIRDIADKAELSGLIADNWGGDVLIMRGRPYSSADITGTAVYGENGSILGFAAWNIDSAALNIMAINAFKSGGGIGRLMLDHLVERARAAQVRSVRIMTTNDNMEALRFYQIYGFRLSAIMVGAIDAYRVVKPTLPLTGRHGIPIRDTIELEILF